jgi:hypothetical protein
MIFLVTEINHMEKFKNTHPAIYQFKNAKIPPLQRQPYLQLLA